MINEPDITIQRSSLKKIEQSGNARLHYLHVTDRTAVDEPNLTIQRSSINKIQQFANVRLNHTHATDCTLVKEPNALSHFDFSLRDSFSEIQRSAQELLSMHSNSRFHQTQRTDFISPSFRFTQQKNITRYL